MCSTTRTVTATGSTTKTPWYSNASNKTAIGSSTLPNALGTALTDNAVMEPLLFPQVKKSNVLSHAKMLRTYNNMLHTLNRL